MSSIHLTLSYEGNDTDDNIIDFYDVSQALIGFQRTLALTTHLVLNGEVITQAPALKNAEIYAYPPEEGSWKWPVIIGAIYTVGTATPQTPIGHLMHSAYDYVISETMGFHVDYDLSLGQQYEQMKESKEETLPILEESQFDSVIEKCEYAIQEMHRPIVKSGSAQRARIIRHINEENVPFEAVLTPQSYDYIRHTNQSNMPEEIYGKISSYNINTFKGRIFVPDERRPIPFTLSKEIQSPIAINAIMQNMTHNANERFIREGENNLIKFVVLKNTSRSGRLKSYYVLGVE